MKHLKPAAVATCLLLLFSLAVAFAAEPAPVEVRLTEYAIEMPGTLPPGPTTFALHNQGHKSHSFKLEGPGVQDMTPVIVQAGKAGTAQVTLQPGEYKVYCPIGSHSAKGMTMTLTVKAK
jgi:hypothetical protein